MRIVIAGSRHYTDYKQAKLFITDCLKHYPKSNSHIILSGGCHGADMLGEQYAAEYGLTIKHFLPDWRRYGAGAGPKRNQAMVDACDIVICFWDGKSRGTRSLICYAKKQGNPFL